MTRTSAAMVAIGVAALCAGAWLWVRARGGEAERAEVAVRGSGEPSAQAESGATAAEQSARARIAALRAQQPEGEARRAALVELLAELAAAQPPLAAALAVELGDDEGRAEALHETLPHLFGSAPADARSFVLNQAPRVPGETGLVLAREAAAFDPALGLLVAQGLGVGLRVPAVQAVFGAWAGSDPAAAARAADELVDLKDYQNAAEEVARLWAETEPQAALSWANVKRSVDARRRSIEAAAATWAAANPEAAAQAMLALPQDATRLRVIDASVAAWAARDADRALAFAEALPVPAEREAALTTALVVMVESRPAAAAETALRIEGGLQSAVADKVLTAWGARDPEAALSWARGRGSDAPQRREVIAFLRERAPGRDARAEHEPRRR